mgnify:CR=1 FL=1
MGIDAGIELEVNQKFPLWLTAKWRRVQAVVLESLQSFLEKLLLQK